MENNKCDCSKCEHWDECEIGLIVHNPISDENFSSSVEVGEEAFRYSQFTINKGNKVAQITLKEHKGYLMGIESDTERNGGFGSTGDVR